MPGVSLVLGTKERLHVVELLETLDAGDPSSEVIALKDETVFEPLTALNAGKTRAQLKIQEGCNRYCTYCIIPYARGPLRSRPLDSVQDELVRLVGAGYREVVLTGIHLMSYGLDMSDGTTLLDAIDLARDIPGLDRVRLGSLEPQLTDDRFVSRLAENGKLCRHFHLSLQSGSDAVLKRMNRRYTAEEYAQCVQRLRKFMPDCAITTDIIAGFPGETEAEFDQTLAFAKRMGLARIHAFPYSRRKGTVAADMPDQLPRAEKLRRTAELIALNGELERAFLGAHIGSVQEVLFEESADGIAQGYTGTYMRVHAKNGTPGSIQRAYINDIGGKRGELFLVGDIIQ